MLFKILKIHGGYSDGVHLFPFRTEKLSPSAQMVLPYKVGEYVAASFTKPRFIRTGVLFFYNNSIPTHFRIFTIIQQEWNFSA